MDVDGNGPAPGTTVDRLEGALAALLRWRDDEQARLAREAEEIGLLLQQTQVESERHEARRQKLADRVRELEGQSRPDAAAVAQAREQHVSAMQRATLMDGQRQVLEGKQKTLARFQERLAAMSPLLDAVIAAGAEPAEAHAVHDGEPHTGTPETPRAVLRAQEDLRRDIARQMHDGPAQSLANIALQAEVVQRLVGRDPERATAEVEHLRRQVQHALDATKTFIFDVRPMVLDDLGLVATIRRAASDRGRRAGLTVAFDSVGADRRLPAELESGFFRIIDDALAGYLGLRPSALAIRLDWSEREVRGTIRSGRADERAETARAEAEARDADPADLPPALAAMIEEQRQEEHDAWTSARALPPARWRDIQARAQAEGLDVSLRDEGQTLEVTAAIPG